MRVLLLAQFYPPVIGGEERHVRNLAVALAARGHDVHVATLKVGPGAHGAAGARVPADPGVHVHLLDNVGQRVPALYPTADRPLALPVPDPLTSRALARLAERLRPDVVHSHNWILASWLPLAAARRTPLVHSLHDYSHVCATKRLMVGGAPCPGPSPSRCVPHVSEHYGALRGVPVYAAVRAGVPARHRRVDLFTPVSRAVAEGNDLASGPVPFEVVPNFVPDELLTRPAEPRHDGLPDAPYVFFAGDLSAEKGLLTLLDAWRRVDRAALGRGGGTDGVPAELVLVGRPTADLPDDLPDGVRVEQGWDHERVVAGFQHARAAVLPSEWHDPCPTTVLEAMALGAPLVTTHQGGIADMVVDGRSALVVPPGDAAATAAALDRLGADPALGAGLTEGARADVRPFLQSAVADRFGELYAQVAAGVPL